MKASIIALVCCSFLSRSLFAASDFQWSFNNDGISRFILTSVSSSQFYAGSIPADNPTLYLSPGSRYAIANSDALFHPVQIIAIGAAGDTVLLSQGSTVGSLESDSTIQFADLPGGTMEFTLSPSLVAAMTQNAEPGYRCLVHSGVMRGSFVFLGTGTPIADPIPQSIPKSDIRVDLSLVADDLTAPLGLTEPEDSTGRLFIWDQTGQVWIVSNGVRLATPFLNVSLRLITLNPNSDERGLLGFAFHPQFSSNGKIYTYTSEPVSGTADFVLPMTGSPNHHSVIAEWTVSAGNPNAIDIASRREILRLDQPQGNHNGGSLAFGQDGMLYIALGDGGARDDEGDGHAAGGNGQAIDRVMGKILRIDVDARTSANGQYGVPPSNPFVGVTGVDEIYAYGFRNPYTFSFDSLTGDLYVGDVGQGAIEEIDKVVLGGNYGWRIKEGSFFFDPNGASNGFATDTPVVAVPPGLIDPIAQYDHSEGVAVICGYVYRGQAIPSLQGHLVFGEFARGATGRLFHLKQGNSIAELQIGANDQPLGAFLKGFGQDADGELYVCVSSSVGPSGTPGKVYRITQRLTAGAHWEMYQ